HKSQRHGTSRAFILLGHDTHREFLVNMFALEIDVLPLLIEFFDHLLSGSVTPRVVVGPPEQPYEARLLLDRSTFPQISELGETIPPGLRSAIELRQNYDRHVELLGRSRDSLCNLVNFLLAIFSIAPLVRPFHALEVIDH